MVVKSSCAERKIDCNARAAELPATSNHTTLKRKATHNGRRGAPSQNRKATIRFGIALSLIVSCCLLLFVAHHTALLFDEHRRLNKDRLVRSSQLAKEEITAKLPPLPSHLSHDGFFNGLPITFHQKSMSSHVQCVGDNYQSTRSWLERSCKFSFLCFDTNTSDFVLFQSQEEQELKDRLVKGNHSFWHTSNTMHHDGQVNHLAVGGINLKWTKAGYSRLQWFPRIEPLHDNNNIIDFYMLPENVVMYPFHSLSAKNPGHLIWDDFLPLYTLLTMFHLDDESISGSTLLFLRYILPGERRGLWASCDWRETVHEQCQAMISKFLPVMVGINATHGWSTTKDYSLSFLDSNGPRSNLICARQGLAGTASLTDHGSKKMHGWEPDDYLISHNHGRGRLLFEFRNFMMRNLDLSQKTFASHPPFKIVVSVGSSEEKVRNTDFELQVEALNRIPGVEITRHTFHEMDLREQARVVSEAQFMLTFCGGGAVTAMFLPRGATLLLFFSETDGVQSNEATGLPAMLDWDIFSNMAYLKVHWISSDTMNHSDDIDVLELLVRQEVGLLSAQL